MHLKICCIFLFNRGVVATTNDGSTIGGGMC